MTLDELKQVKESLKECRPSVEDFAWGPTFEFAEKRKVAALKILRHAIKECKKDKDVRN